MASRLPEGDSRPTLLLVHGAFFGAWSWDGVRAELAARDWPTQTVDLVSVAERGSRRLGLFDDAEVVRQRIKGIDGPVVVVAHSYGGAVVTQAAADLPNVRHLVYVCSFQLEIGESLLGLAGGLGTKPHWWNIDGEIMTPHDPLTVLVDDVPGDEAERAVARLRPLSFCATTQEVTAAAWHDIPSTYIVADLDKALPPEAQALLAARATYVRHLPSGHLPLLSMPAALTDLIVEAVSHTGGHGAA
jgi:pimeloyl-ACP methyl ester carboxylesterase